MALFIGVSVFFVVMLIIGGISLLRRSRLEVFADRIEKHTRVFSLTEAQSKVVDITKKRRKLSEIIWLDRLLGRIPFVGKIDEALPLADIRFPIAYFILVTGILALFGFLMVFYNTQNIYLSVLAVFPIGSAPFFYVIVMKNLRVRKFERQLPEALDLLARSLRAGHAFASGLRLLAEEFDRPLGSEFAKVIEETNFGVGIKEALINFSGRIDCSNLKFFVMAVALQRETGGDLAEILENISRLIRERFKLQSKINALSAEGKLSAIVLIALPFFIGLALFMVSPDYVYVLFREPMGKMLLIMSFSTMFLGAVVMKKMVNIKV